jgi:orotidine-5'-phosphate decarboxylase
MAGNNFADRLLDAIENKENPSVVGLDPRIGMIPKHIWQESEDIIEATAETILVFNKELIDAICDIVPAVKPNVAFYECYGAPGFKSFVETCKYAEKRGMVVHPDTKRNDIGSTAQAYSNGLMGLVEVAELVGEDELKKVPSIDVDGTTINAYLGIDGINPFLNNMKERGKGCYILVKTSNKSSGDFQDLPVTLMGEDKKILKKKLEPNETPLGMLYDSVDLIYGPNYVKMALNVDKWGPELVGKRGYSSVGAVVGATYPREAKLLRKVMPTAIILVPGYGAQGGGAKEVLPNFDRYGHGAIVNSSRGVCFHYKKNDNYTPKLFAEAARHAAEVMKNDICGALKEAGKLGW